jgi:two-component system, cell cycle response regulator DivK
LHPNCDILLVDDDARILKELSWLLEHDGHRVRCASGGAEGLAEMRRKPPRLLLLDLQMPIVSGFEVLRLKKIDPSLADVPVIVVTTLIDAGPKDATIKAVFEKMGDLNVLLLLVAAHCGCEARPA